MKKEINTEELKVFREMVDKSYDEFAGIYVLETDWDIDLTMEIAIGNIELIDLCGEELLVGNINDIINIRIDEYAKIILVDKESEKDTLLIDEDGGISYFGVPYVFKSREMEDREILKYAEIEVIPDEKYRIEGNPVIRWHGCFDKAFEYCSYKHSQGIETVLVHGLLRRKQNIHQKKHCQIF